jgi:hypothetical protein
MTNEERWMAVRTGGVMTLSLDPQGYPVVEIGTTWAGRYSVANVLSGYDGQPPLGAFGNFYVRSVEIRGEGTWGESDGTTRPHKAIIRATLAPIAIEG